MTDAHPHPALLHALSALAEPAPTTLLERLGSALDQGDRYVAVEGPGGRVWVAFTERGISLLSTAADEDEFRAELAARRGFRPLRRASAPPPGLVQALAARTACTDASPTAAGSSPAPAGPDLRYDLTGLSRFQQDVLDKTAEIPAGEVRPYAWVAREVGRPAAVRAVGTALGRNPVPILIPCHRVVRSDGRIGAYALGTEMKSRLLTEEGVDLSELVELAAAGIRYVGDARSRTYCHPTCHAVRALGPDERLAFRSAGEAVRAGHRPCPQCRPVAIAS